MCQTVTNPTLLLYNALPNSNFLKACSSSTTISELLVSSLQAFLQVSKLIFRGGLTYPLSNIFYPNLFFDLSSSRAVEVFRPQVRKEGRAPLGAFDPIL